MYSVFLTVSSTLSANNILSLPSPHHHHHHQYSSLYTQQTLLVYVSSSSRAALATLPTIIDHFSSPNVHPHSRYASVSSHVISPTHTLTQTHTSWLYLLNNIATVSYLSLFFLPRSIIPVPSLFIRFTKEYNLIYGIQELKYGL